MKQGRFLVLGIGPAQVDLLEYLQGVFEVHACSNVAEGPGLLLCDRFSLIDITDINALHAYCLLHAIDYVYSVGSDLAMPSVAMVSEQMSLPCFVSPETAWLCNSKRLFREKTSATRAHVEFAVLTHADDPVQLPVPLIVKPVDSQGQRGITVVHRAEHLPGAFHVARSHSRSGAVIAEAFLQGDEISVSAYLRDGNLEFFMVSDRISWPDYDGGFIHKHIVPSTISMTAHGKVRRLVQEVATLLGILNGPAYFQIKVVAGKPRLIEVTPRLDGCHLWRLLSWAAGVDLLDLTLKHLTRQPYVLPNALPMDATWVLEFFCEAPGRAFRRKEHPVHRNAVHSCYYYEDGQIVRVINGYKEKCGYQIYRV